MSVGSPAHGTCTFPGSSTYFAPGISRARKRPFSTWQMLSPTRCRTSVGTWTAETTSRTSMSNAMRMNAIASPGVADIICSRPNHSCVRSGFGSSGKEVARREPFAPALGQQCHQRLELLRRGLAPGPVVRFRLLDLGAHEQQRLDPLRVGRREDHRHRPAFGDAQQHGALRAGGVQHRPRVVHAVVERADARPLGEAHPPLVEQDQPRERRELLAEAAVGRVLPERSRWVRAPPSQMMSGGPSPSTW